MHPVGRFCFLCAGVVSCEKVLLQRGRYFYWVSVASNGQVLLPVGQCCFLRASVASPAQVLLPVVMSYYQWVCMCCSPCGDLPFLWEVLLSMQSFCLQWKSVSFREQVMLFIWRCCFPWEDISLNGLMLPPLCMFWFQKKLLLPVDRCCFRYAGVASYNKMFLPISRCCFSNQRQNFLSI